MTNDQLSAALVNALQLVDSRYIESVFGRSPYASDWAFCRGTIMFFEDGNIECGTLLPYVEECREVIGHEARVVRRTGWPHDRLPLLKIFWHEGQFLSEERYDVGYICRRRGEVSKLLDGGSFSDFPLLMSHIFEYE